MQLNRNTIVPIAIGMLAIAAARAEAAPLVHAGAAPAVCPAMGDALLWGLDFAAKAGAFSWEGREGVSSSRAGVLNAIDEAAPAMDPMACLGEETDGALAHDTAMAVAEEGELCEGCGIAEATWGEASGALLFDAPTFDVAEAPTLETTDEPASVELPALDVSSAPMPIYVSICLAVVDAMKADLANQPEAAEGSSADEPSDESAEDVVTGDCCDEAAVADASDLDGLSTDEQAPELMALVACGDRQAAIAAAGSIKRGVIRFFQALVRAAAERHDAVLESAEVIDEVVDAPAPEFAEDHVPEVLTLF